MRKSLISALFLFLAALHGAELKFLLDGETRKVPGVKYFSSSIRQVPGRFGKALLIERRTVNSFAPADAVLSEGVKFGGKTNHLVLPANAFAALPLTTIRPGSANTLSFLYRGEGKITVTFNRKELASFQAGPEYREGAVAVVPEDDAGTLRIRAEKAAELDKVMFDKGIGCANTYHAPGKMRNVDVINVDPALYSPEKGAISCWIKAPWLRPDAKFATGIALCAVQGASAKARKPMFISVWSNGLGFHVPGVAGKSVSVSCGLAELPESPDNWYHFVFNWERKGKNMDLSLIVNGEKVFSKSGVAPAPGPNGAFGIGYVNGAYLNGILDDFGLFAAPLSLGEAKRIYQAKRPLQELFPR